MFGGSTMNGTDFIKALDEGRHFSCYIDGTHVYRMKESDRYIVITPSTTICVVIDKLEVGSDNKSVVAFNNGFHLDVTKMIDTTEVYSK